MWMDANKDGRAFNCVRPQEMGVGKFGFYLDAVRYLDTSFVEMM